MRAIIVALVVLVSGVAWAAPRVVITATTAAKATTLTPEAVRTRIEAVYRPGLVRCYGEALKADPTAAGKLVANFDVGTTGRLSNVKVATFAPALERCVANLMGAWTFPVPKAEDGTPTDGAFAVTFELTP